MSRTTFDMAAGALSRILARTPVPFSGRNGRGTSGGWGARDYSKRAQMATVFDNSDLFSIVNRTSTSTAAVNWRLWRSSPSGRAEDRVEIPKGGHQALRVWQKPNDFYTGREFTEAGVQHIDLTGETWWVVERGSVPGFGALSFPTAMWVVRPDRMTPVPSREEFLSGYMYTGPDGEEVALTIDQVIVQKMPNPLDPYRGLGPVQSLLLTIDGEQAMAEWNANFYRNSAQPGGVLKVPGFLSDPQFDKLRDRWNDQHKGVSNAHRVAILEGGLDWVPRAYSQREMQVAETANVTPDKIKRAFGISGFALGELQDANRAAAEAASVWFSQNLTVPRLDRIKDALNFQYLPMFGDTTRGLEFDYDSPVEPDQSSQNETLTARTEAYAKLVAAGVTPKDAAKTVGLPEMQHTVGVAA